MAFSRSSGTLCTFTPLLAIALMGVLASGSAWAADAQPAQPQALRLHPENPRIFEFRGKPTVLVTSGEHYGAVVNLDFDYRVYLAELASRGLNYTRVFTGSYVAYQGASGIEKNTLAPAPGRFLAPWARSTTPGYAHGGNKFDLKRWDLAYFDRLKDFVVEAGRRGIVVEVTLFSSLYDDKGWQASPLHEGNNVNGLGKLDRKKVHTLDNGKLYGYQEALVRQVVRALADADNVVFEIQNEPWVDLGADSGFVSRANDASLAWQKKIAAAIVQEAKRSGRMPIVAQNIANRSIKISEPDPNVSLFNFHHSRPPEVVALNLDIPRAFGLDQTGREGTADAAYRQQGWLFLLAGGTLFNNLDHSFTTARENGTDTQNGPGGGSSTLRAQLGVLSRFMQGFGPHLVHMRPDAAFIKQGAASETKALVAPGKAYALYMIRGQGDKPGPVELSLDIPFGSYNFEWLDPVSGKTVSSGRWVSPGGVGRLQGPVLEQELALRLVRSREEPVASELPRGSRASATSPDGRTQISLVLADLGGLAGYEDGARLYYRVEQGENSARSVVLPWSPLGIRRTDEDFVKGLTWGRVQSKQVRERYTLSRGKAVNVTAAAEETTVIVRGSGGGSLAIDLRAYNDGVAFRYRFPDRAPGWYQVEEEETGFRVPLTGTGYLMAHDDPNQWKPAYENDWLADVPAGTASPQRAGWSFPALFHLGSHWVLLTESGLDRNYAGTRLAQQAPGGLYRVRFPDPAEGEGLGATKPRWTLPWAMPWRTIMVGSDLGTIVASNLVTHLAAPSVVANTKWIQPGRSAWSWWSDSDSPQDYARMLPFIDMAAQMGWEYFLVDANWHRMKGGDWKQLATYAKGKKVRLLLWYNSGGPNNSVTEQPRDRMSDREIRRAEMKAISDAGIAGIKVDFFQSDKQVTIAQHLDLLQDAADFKLLVNFHGCTLPRGWSRTFPNLMAHEAVRGAEMYKFSNRFPPYAAVHNTILAFARNVVGPMDYTPVTFSDMEFPHQTTNAHELALSVVFESGILHLADSVKAYMSLPEAPRQFLKEVPVTWDETRLVAGHPGKQAVFARRKGSVWYVGGISGLQAASNARVPLSGFGQNGNGKGKVQVTFIGDGDSDRSFTSRTAVHAAGETIDVPMRARGGFVMRISPAR